MRTGVASQLRLFDLTQLTISKMSNQYLIHSKCRVEQNAE